MDNLEIVSNNTIKRTNPNINFTQSQQVAINGLLEFINSPFDSGKFINGLIGSGGTGKTFTINYIINACNYAISTIRCTAPTHKACRVLSQALNGLKVETIQSTFGFRLDTKLEDFDYNNPRFSPVSTPKLENIKVLIIDESSMLPAKLVNYIIKICKPLEIKIIFIGDSSQLPPVNEKISTAFNVCNKLYQLTEIVRQEDNNPILFLLNILREDIKNNTYKFISYVNANLNSQNVNEFGDGYFICNPNDFTQLIDERFRDEEYLKNINLYKIIGYTNDKVAIWNNFVRNRIIKDADKTIINKNDLIMSYQTIVNEFNSIVINNSEEYIVKDIINYTDTIYGFKGFLVKFQMVNGGNVTTPLFILDHTDRFSITKYIQVIGELVKAAKFANGATRSKRWKEYFEFKKKYLIMCNIKNATQVLYQRDIDYGFAITSHRSQGSTYDNVFVDMKDIIFDKNNNIYNNKAEMLRRLYVACSRTRHKLYICYGKAE